jgi:hypothetical protein
MIKGYREIEGKSPFIIKLGHIYTGVKLISPSVIFMPE